MNFDKKEAEKFLKEKKYQVAHCMEEKHKENTDKFVFECKDTNGSATIIKLVHTPDTISDNELIKKLYSKKLSKYKTHAGGPISILWKNNNMHVIEPRKQNKDIIGYVSYKFFTKQSAVDFLKNNKYEPTLCLEQKHENGIDIFTFECGDRPQEENKNLVCVRMVLSDVSTDQSELEKYLRPSAPIKYKVPSKGIFEINWTNPLVKERLHNIPGYGYVTVLVTDFTKSVPHYQTMSEIPFDLKNKLEREYLDKQGYRILDLLGSGGFGQVYACENRNGNKVAVKVVMHPKKEVVDMEISASRKVSSMKPLDLSKFPDFKFNSALEERSKIFKEHINVPMVQAVGGKDDLYIALLEAPIMDTSLEKENFKFSKLNPEETDISTAHREIKSIAKSVLSALKMLHSRNMVHLDIKPANILSKKINGGVNVYALTDFGLLLDAKYHHDPQKSKLYSLYKELKHLYSLISHGTLFYMSPEVLNLRNNTSVTSNLSKLLDNLKSVLKNQQPHSHENDISSNINISCGEILLEQLKKIGFKSDMFSLGASLVDIVLNKFPELKGRMGNYNTKSPDWGSMSRQLFLIMPHKTHDDEKENTSLSEFLQKLTAEDPDDRPTAAEALSDPYLK